MATEPPINASISPASARPNDGQAGTGEVDILLPGFVSRRSDGLYADISQLESEQDFLKFAERVFSSNAYFSNLDYPMFLKLLYVPNLKELTEQQEAESKSSVVKLASNIVPFLPERRQIYRDPKISEDGSTAEYLFEPVIVEQADDEVAVGEEAPSPIENQTKQVTLQPNPDEFIAAMWEKGIRFGLEMDEISKVINKASVERLEIAQILPCIPGKDASYTELTDALHQDHSPKVLPSGRVDLAGFRNHFPQVAYRTRLIKKTPRVLGKPGWNLDGSLIDPGIPLDFELEMLAGPGTSVERTSQGEFIFAAITGFLTIDNATNQISINEKIINRNGVNMHTTGDLTLTGPDYEEYGEVEELRHVTGHNMTFFADVFGHLISDSGIILVKHNLSNGTARNSQGQIIIEGSTKDSVIEDKEGEITINIAENSFVIGRKVRIEHAVNCDILAEEVEVVLSEGSAIAGKTVKIGKTSARKSTETVVSVLLPDETAWDKEIDELVTRIKKNEQARQGRIQTSEELSNQPMVQKLLFLMQKIKAKEITLKPEQQADMERALVRFSPTLHRISDLSKEIGEIRRKEEALKEQILAIKKIKEQAMAVVSCSINSVVGDTTVHTMKIPFEGFPLDGLPPKEIHHHLREHGSAHEQLFSGESGEFVWPQPPEDEVPPDESAMDGSASAIPSDGNLPNQ